ncbi:cubilin homolog, partial [Stegodyphus dumicola]|uniref:cubilin homolog n=1 Tax=Stegodyphus dumicola TaxID=202533 RepID=UPI0015AF5DE9
YTGDGHSCTDINECEINNGGCSVHPFLQCTNTIGSRICGACPAGCGGFLNGNTGTLKFPENGVHYIHVMGCAWVITVDDDKVVNITFEHFGLESGLNCEFDFLQLNDGPNAASHVIGRFCQDDLQNRSFVSTHNQLYIWFRSNRTVAATGFSLNWTAAEPG